MTASTTTAPTPAAPALDPALESATSVPAPVGLARLARAGRQQVFVAAGQVAAGTGNLAFVAIAARVLDERAFGHVAAFVALYTALHVPGVGLTAVAALDPERAPVLARRAAVAGAVVAAALAVAAGPVAAVTGLPAATVLALAAAAPAAPLLGLRRGAAYGRRQHRAVVRSLVAEPVARCTVGVALGAVLGGSGAAWGVVAGGWLALLAVPGYDARRAPVHRDVAARATRSGLAPAIGFMLLTLLQHQDVVVANRLLPEADIGAFAALSTVGGLVAFATATLPMVLLPAAAAGERENSTVAIAAAAAVGGAGVIAGLAAPDRLLGAVVGSGYESAEPYVAPYLAAMAALGLARVLAAARCGRGDARRVATVAGVALVAHLAGLVLGGRSIGGVVAVTGGSLAFASVALAFPSRRADATTDTARPSWRERAKGADAPLLGVLVAVATAIRLATNRSVWIDEATSVAQARLPFGAMLADLARTDVHPPLHHAVLWVTTRVLGTGEVAIRMPSLIAGALTVPALYGLARELFDRRTARVVAVLAVPAPFLVWYAQEARMYSLFILAGVCSLWAQVAAMRRGSWRSHLAWAVAAAAVIWTQWFGILPVAVQLVGGFVVALRRRRARRRAAAGAGANDPPAAVDAAARRPVLALAGTAVVIAVLLLPLVPLLLDQLAAYSERGAGLSTTPQVAGLDAAGVERDSISAYAVVANVLWAATGYHSDTAMAQLGATWPVGMLLALLALGRRWTSETKILVGVAVVPAVVLLAVGTLKRDLFELRYFALLAPLLLVLAARTASTLARGRILLGVATVALAVASVVGLVDQQLNGANPRLYDFRGAIADIRADAGDDARVALEPSYLETVTDYYGPDLRTGGLGALDVDKVDEDGIDVLVAERFIAGRASSAAVGRVLHDLETRFGPAERIERPNVIVWRFR